MKNFRFYFDMPDEFGEPQTYVTRVNAETEEDGKAMIRTATRGLATEIRHDQDGETVFTIWYGMHPKYYRYRKTGSGEWDKFEDNPRWFTV